MDLFYDTSDYHLLRKGIWLRQRQGQWQTRYLYRYSSGNVMAQLVPLN